MRIAKATLVKAALHPTAVRLGPTENTSSSAARPPRPPQQKTPASIGLGKTEPKASLAVGGEERSTLSKNLSRDLERMLEQLGTVLDAEAPTAAARAKLAARVKANRSALEALQPPALPGSALAPALSAALTAQCAALERRAAACSPSEARWLPGLAQQLKAIADLAGAQPPPLARSYHSAAETFRVWSEAYRADPTATVERFRAAFEVPLAAAQLQPVLHKLLGHPSGRRAFIQATRSWLRPEIRAQLGSGALGLGQITTLRPRLHGGRVALSTTTKITEASQIAPMSRDPSGKVGNLLVVGQGPIGLLTAVLTKARPENAGTAVYLVDKRGAGGEMEYSRPIKLAVRNGFLNLLAGARAPGSKQSVLDLLRERGQLHFLEGTSGEISHHRTAHQPRGVIGEAHSAIIETRHLERAIRDVAAKIPGIHFLNGYKPKLTATGALGLDGQPTFSVSLEKGGHSHSIGTPDLIVAADGASSHTVRDAGIGLKVGQALGRYVAGTVRVPTSAKNSLAKLKVDNGTPIGARVYANTVGSLGESWMIVDLPSSWSNADLLDRPKVSAYFKEMCGKALGKPAAELEVSYGGDQAFTLRPTITTEAGRGNVMPVGDASGNNTFVVGAGTVGGAHEALIAAQTIAALNSSSSAEDAAARLAQGLQRSYLAAAAWHQASPKAVQQDLGLPTLLGKNVIEPRRKRVVPP